MRVLPMVFTRRSRAGGSGGARKGIFARMMAGLAADHGEKTTVMIDATYLKVHRAATSMAANKGAWSPDRSN